VLHSLGGRSSADIACYSRFPPRIDARARRVGAHSDWSESRARSPRWLCTARTVNTSEQASFALGLVQSHLALSRCSCVNS
jgi:hypothetical protein